MANVRFRQYSNPHKKKDQLSGYQIGVWTTAAIFMDKYEVDGEDVKELIEEALALMVGIGDGRYSTRALLDDLEKKTGVECRIV